MARTDTLGNFLTDVAEAIRAKEGTTGKIPASEFDTRIANLSSGGTAKYAPRAISFEYYTGDELDYELANLDASNVTVLYNFLAGCENIKSLDISGLTFGTITDMRYGFYNNSSLTSLILGNLDTSNITTLFYAFASNDVLPSLDLSSLDFSNVTNMYGAFSWDEGLKFLDVRTINFSKVTSYTDMLYKVPTSCEIIVADDTQKQWFASKFGSYGNVKTVAEYEAQ